ncbi:MAG: DUF4340 domain-containing protein [Cyanobacteria bacterium J06614_10]
MLNRGTLVLLVSAIALGGAVLLFENRQTDNVQVADPGATADSIVAGEEGAGEKLFPFEEEDIEQFSLTRFAESEEDTEELAFEKQDDGTWQMTMPRQAMAEGGAIAFLLSQLTSPASRTLTVEADTLEEFGLSDPEATVVLSVEGADYTFYLGGSDFSGDRRYAQAVGSEADAGEEPTTTTVHVLSGGIETAINRPTAEWLVVEASPEAEPAETESSEAESSEAESSEAESPSAQTSETEPVEGASSESETPRADSTESALPATEAPDQASEDDASESEASETP